MIKLLIGGSPCTYWSIAQKNNRETEPSGMGWELFKNYLIAKEKFKPDFFLYENNKSADEAIKREIRKQFGVWDCPLFLEDTGVRYIEINSALVSAQNRERFYVHNCVMYCEIKFNDEISGEHPLMAEWIPTAEKRLKELFGITVEHASNGTYLQHFFTKKQKGKYVGSSMSFPLVIGAWCNSRLKIAAISKYLVQFKKQTITQFVGIAYDEPRRWGRMKAKETKNRKYRSLLVEQELTEQDAFRICEKYGLLSPMYKSNDEIYRGGCWFCPKQCNADLYSLWKNYPDYYQKLVELEPYSPCNKFKPYGNPSDYAKRFEAGYVPVRRKKRATEKQISIDEYLEDIKNER